MEEATIRPGYTVPTETDGTPADYSAIEAAVNAHNQNAQPGEAYWGIRLCGAEYEVYEYGEVPQPPTAEELAAQEKAHREAQQRQEVLDKLPETLEALKNENEMLHRLPHIILWIKMEMRQIDLRQRPMPML